MRWGLSLLCRRLLREVFDVSWCSVVHADGVRAMASQAKIKVDNPVVDLDGDEMTRCDIDQMKGGKF